MIFDYHLVSQKLLRVQEEKDLGIMLTSNLTWDSHVNLIMIRGKQTPRPIEKNMPSTRDSKVRRSLYLSLVKSLLCYGKEIWSPGNYTLKTMVVRVQRRATNWILMCKPGEINTLQRETGKIKS